MLKYLFILLSVVLAGCATTEYQYVNTNPEWNPDKGLEWAKVQCEAKADLASSSDWVDTLLSQGIMQKQSAYRGCMKAFGYDTNIVKAKNKQSKDSN